MLESLDSVPRARLTGAGEPGQNGPSSPARKAWEQGEGAWEVAGTEAKPGEAHPLLATVDGHLAAGEALSTVLTASPGCNALPAVLNVWLALERCPWS